MRLILSTYESLSSPPYRFLGQGYYRLDSRAATVGSPLLFKYDVENLPKVGAARSQFPEVVRYANAVKSPDVLRLPKILPFSFIVYLQRSGRIPYIYVLIECPFWYVKCSENQT